MRFLLVLLLLLPLLPGADRRNTETPNTDTHFKMPAYNNVDTWKARREALRRQIRYASGLVPEPPKTPLNPMVSGRIEGNGYTIEKAAIETMPGYWLGGNLYRPAGGAWKGPYPAVLHPHGHWTYGRLEHQPLYAPQSFGINLAKRGFVVFAYDMAGYNDTNQTPHEFGTPQQMLWTFGPFALQTWNSIRALDWMESLPDVDPKRIAISGASGGGTQTFILAALDDRIAVSAPVNMVSLIMQGGCVCENTPGLRIGANNAEIAAMMAPKPMLLVAATGDWTRNVPKEEFPAIRSVYQLFGKPEMVEAVQFDSPHNFHKESREAVYEFFRKHLTPSEASAKESNVRVEQLQDMLVFFNRPRPEGALDYAQVEQAWRSSARTAVERTNDPALLREWLRGTLNVEWPRGVEVSGGFMTRAGQGQAIPYRWIEGTGKPVLYLHPAGMTEAERSSAVAKLKESNRPILLIDSFQSGAAAAPRDRSHKHFLTFNPSDDAARAQDILTALRWLEIWGASEVEVVAEGNARWWALFGAAAANPGFASFATQPGEFAASDQALLEHFYVPGLQRVGGVSTAIRLLQK